MRRLDSRILPTRLKWRSLATNSCACITQPSLNLKEYLDALDQGEEFGVFALARLIRECGISKNLQAGTKLHAHVINSGLERGIYLQECLVHMYLKCGSLQNAEAFFLDKTKLMRCSRDVTAWTAMLSAYCRDASDRALEFYWAMLQSGVKPDKFTFSAVLKACVASIALSEGRSVHSQISECGYDEDEIIGTSIVSMYGKCCSMVEARAWFDAVGVRCAQRVELWNAMISAYFQNGCYRESMDLFKLMLLEGLTPNSITFVTVLNACSSPLALEVGGAVHVCVGDLGLESDVIVGTALLNMYGKCEKMEEAEKIFARIREPDLVSWNSMISAHVRCDRGTGSKSPAVTLFKLILLEGLAPNEITYIGALNACALSPSARSGNLAEGRLIHRCSHESGRASVVFVRNALIDMYGKCGCLENARELFESETIDRNLVTWSVMVAAYVENGCGLDALQLFRIMNLEGLSLDTVVFVNAINACSSVGDADEGERLRRCLAEAGFESDLVVATALVNMYAKSGRLEDGREVFDRIGVRNVVSWNTMLSGYAQNGYHEEALQLFHQIDPDFADRRSYVAALDACACSADVTQGKLIHQLLLQREISVDMILGTAVVNMYGKCGCLSEARDFFDSIALPDTVTFNAMIAAYSQHGHLHQAVRLFGRMKQEGVRPDVATFVSLLCACSHAGKLEVGSEFFVSMVVDYELKISSEHCGCMLDLLSRTGMLREAEELLRKLPTSASDAEWVALLTACKTQSDTSRAHTAAEGLLHVAPETSFPYVALSAALSATDKNETLPLSNVL